MAWHPGVKAVCASAAGEAPARRDATYDIMKCVGIVLMLFGHRVYDYWWLTKFIFSFHMPLFFIVAGYFYRPRPLREAVAKDARRLLLPYVVTCAAVVALDWAFCAFDGRPLTLYYVLASLYGSGSTGHRSLYMSGFNTIGAVWFLLALFWCKTIYNALYLRLGLARAIACSLCLCAVAFPVERLVNLPLAILPGLVAMVFFAIGNVAARTDASRRMPAWLLAALVVAWGVEFVRARIDMASVTYGFFPLDVAGACGATWVVWLVSSKVGRSGGAAARIMAWVGMNSMAILCFHLIDLDTDILGHLGIRSPALKFLAEVPLWLLAVWGACRIPFVRKVYGVRPLPAKAG